jgi:hypothetical protein
MNRLLTYWIAAASVLGVLGAAGAQQPIFRSIGEAIRVFVTVTDRDGRLVTTLRQEDFEIRDEGTPQPITLFDNTPQPIRIIVMLDLSGDYGRTISRALVRSVTTSPSAPPSREISKSFARPCQDQLHPMRPHRCGVQLTKA